MNGINLLDGWFKFPVGDAAFYAVFGFVFVFLGIVLLILILTCLGKGISAWRGRKKKKRSQAVEEAPQTSLPEPTAGISPEVIAAIAAAVAAYTEAETGKCDFIVRRIRKI